MPLEHLHAKLDSIENERAANCPVERVLRRDFDLVPDDPEAGKVIAIAPALIFAGRKTQASRR